MLGNFPLSLLCSSLGVLYMYASRASKNIALAGISIFPLRYSCCRGKSGRMKWNLLKIYLKLASRKLPVAAFELFRSSFSQFDLARIDFISERIAIRGIHSYRGTTGEIINTENESLCISLARIFNISV